MKRSLLLVVFVAILFLSGCVDLDLSLETPPNPSTPYFWGDAYAICDDAWGGNFYTPITPVLGSLYVVTFIDIMAGINPIALPYQCKIYGSGGECCEFLTINAEDLFKSIPLTLTCGPFSPCSIGPY